MSKNKIKTHKAAAKRFSVTGSGKVLARHMSVAHRARFKSKRSKQKSTQNQVISYKGAVKLIDFLN